MSVHNRSESLSNAALCYNDQESEEDDDLMGDRDIEKLNSMWHAMREVYKLF